MQKDRLEEHLRSYVEHEPRNAWEIEEKPSSTVWICLVWSQQVELSSIGAQN